MFLDFTIKVLGLFSRTLPPTFQTIMIAKVLFAADEDEQKKKKTTFPHNLIYIFYYLTARIRGSIKTGESL